MRNRCVVLALLAVVYRFDERLDVACGERPASAQLFLRMRFASKGMDHHSH